MATEKKDTPKLEVGGRAAKMQDNTCRVRIYISGTDAKTRKGIAENITKTLYVNGATVSGVEKAIVKALT